jgi:hypothetical protein
VLRLMVGIGVMACVPAARADLEWQEKEVKAAVHPLQASVTVAFSFTNRGEEPVRITELNPLCGCISATVPDKMYAPGEAGTLDVTFDFGRRKGEQWKGLEVKTSDASERPVKLYVIAHIPETYKPSAISLSWAVGEGNVARTYRLVNHHSQAFRLIQAEAPEEQLKVELKPVRDGFEYDLIVTPSFAATETKGVIPITLVPETPNGLETVKTFTVYAVIK